jgi:hypothetical protein
VKVLKEEVRISETRKFAECFWDFKFARLRRGDLLRRGAKTQ